MSLSFPNGAIFGFSTAIAAAVTASAVSNANPAVATVPAASIDEGDVLVIQSGWPLANNSAVKAGSAATAVDLLGLDSSDTTLYPAGEAAMTLAVASGFVDFSQQGDLSQSGGEQNFWTGQFLEDPTGRQINVPTFKSAKVLTLPLFYDPSQPWYAAARLVDAKKEPVVLRCKLPNGDEQYRYGYLSFDGDPSMAVNTPMGNTATFTALGETVLVEAAS